MLWTRYFSDLGVSTHYPPTQCFDWNNRTQFARRRFLQLHTLVSLQKHCQQALILTMVESKFFLSKRTKKSLHKTFSLKFSLTLSLRVISDFVNFVQFKNFLHKKFPVWPNRDSHLIRLLGPPLAVVIYTAIPNCAVVQSAFGQPPAVHALFANGPRFGGFGRRQRILRHRCTLRFGRSCRGGLKTQNNLLSICLIFIVLEFFTTMIHCRMHGSVVIVHFYMIIPPPLEFICIKLFLFC